MTDEEVGSTGRIAAIGVAGGVVGGLIGGGAGVLFVPALDRFTSMTRARVHGTSTVAQIGLCVAGAATYAIGGGALDLAVGTPMAVGATFGGALGPWLLARTHETVLRVLLIAILLLTAAKFGIDAFGPPLFTHALVPPALLADPWFVVPTTLVVGLVVGAWSGAMGLGGGLLAVPAMVLLFGVELHVAAGTSLLMFIPNSVVGTVVHVRQGTASARWGWVLGLTSAPGVIVGALLGLALHTEVLGLVFGTFALLMAVREIVALARRRSRAGVG
ncbi:sulfite exporter TauE/SafE family protein [Actinomycetospora sp. NBRC 106375]|uniref:sulfite exporter TauE/SafE family protein n=1 Tax=Actinomycetospora sp. NBRC 106375 TaxID=3032207 RepID=UPI0025529DDD|nr:sulfite exporter TauE/SafE family protein [Actinomycetospora sp. NBRC 106375]